MNQAVGEAEGAEDAGGDGQLGAPTYRYEPGLLLSFLWRAAYLVLIPFRAYPTYFTTYFVAYFTSTRPSLKSKHLFELILLISTFSHLISKIDIH